MSLLARHFGWPARQIVRARDVKRLNTSAPPSTTHEPLRVLFCGSDAFSIFSLQALHALHLRSPSAVQRIEVLCRPDKRAGRGLKHIQAVVPIKAVAQELDLQLYQLDSFKDWSSSTSAPNLIVTASFGLLVPGRVLSQAKYGGINVHPSLLPDFRGAAPIQHAIMQRAKVTGVSVQTMHPTKFDHGHVLVQQEVELVKASHDQRSLPSTADLIQLLGPIGGDLLVDTISRGLFQQSDTHDVSNIEHGSIRRAPKIQPADRMIAWDTWTSDDIVARDLALGQLWDNTTFARSSSQVVNNKRTVFTGPWSVVSKSDSATSTAGTPVLVVKDGSTDAAGIAIETIDGALVRPSTATIEADAKGRGLATLQRMLSTKSKL